MVSDEDWTLLVTEAVKNVPLGQEFPGSEVRWCYICGEPVWVSQFALRKMERNHTMRPACAACGVPLMQQEARRNDGKLRVDPIDPSGPPVRPLLTYLKREYGTDD